MQRFAQMLQPTIHLVGRLNMPNLEFSNPSNFVFCRLSVVQNSCLIFAREHLEVKGCVSSMIGSSNKHVTQREEKE